jgi:glycosyltransferase involved in cell wall biosynthesis
MEALAKMCRVTVCIPIYNRSEALRSTVDSVLAQTFPDWELLLVDDGSTDDTPQVAQSYGDPRIRYIRQENRGHSAARNHGLAVAQGEYIAYLDHDDRWWPDKLRLQVAYLDAHPEAGVVYGRFRRIDEAGRDLGLGGWHEAAGWIYEELLAESNFLGTMSLPLIRTELVRQVGGFNPRMDTADDLDLFLRLARITPFGLIPEVLLDYNVGNAVQQSRDHLRVIWSEWECLRRPLRSGVRLSAGQREKVLERCRMYSRVYWHQAYEALRAGDPQTALRYYFQAVRFRPALLGSGRFVLDLLAVCKRTLVVSLRTPR